MSHLSSTIKNRPPKKMNLRELRTRSEYWLEEYRSVILRSSKEYQAACMENQTAFMEYHETVMNRKSSRAYKEAITQQHQEAVRGIPRSFNGIPNTTRLWRKPRVNSCPDSGHTKLHKKRPKNDAKPGQGQAQMPWNGTKKAAQGHMDTKLMPKRAKIPKMTPGGKSIIFYTSLDRFRVPAWVHFRSKIR